MARVRHMMTAKNHTQCSNSRGVTYIRVLPQILRGNMTKRGKANGRTPALSFVQICCLERRERTEESAIGGNYVTPTSCNLPNPTQHGDLNEERSWNDVCAFEELTDFTGVSAGVCSREVGAAGGGERTPEGVKNDENAPLTDATGGVTSGV